MDVHASLRSKRLLLLLPHACQRTRRRWMWPSHFLRWVRVTVIRAVSKQRGSTSCSQARNLLQMTVGISEARLFLVAADKLQSLHYLSHERPLRWLTVQGTSKLRLPLWQRCQSRRWGSSCPGEGAPRLQGFLDPEGQLRTCTGFRPDNSSTSTTP